MNRRCRSFSFLSHICLAALRQHKDQRLSRTSWQTLPARRGRPTLEKNPAYTQQQYGGLGCFNLLSPPRARHPFGNVGPALCGHNVRRNARVQNLQKPPPSLHLLAHPWGRSKIYRRGAVCAAVLGWGRARAQAQTRQQPRAVQCTRAQGAGAGTGAGAGADGSWDGNATDPQPAGYSGGALPCMYGGRSLRGRYQRPDVGERQLTPEHEQRVQRRDWLPWARAECAVGMPGGCAAGRGAGACRSNLRAQRREAKPPGGARFCSAKMSLAEDVGVGLRSIIEIHVFHIR